MNRSGQKVAIITGPACSPGTGGLGWAVVASARRMKPPDDPDLLVVEGDIADPGTAGQLAGATLSR